MPKVSELTPESRFVALFVGGHHSGKTCAAASFSEHPSCDKTHPIEFLDFDLRIRGILGAPWLKTENINYTSYPPKMDNLIQELNKKLDSWLLSQKMNMPLPAGIIGDSVTNMTLGFLCQSLPLTHGSGYGRTVGVTQITGPDDYKLEAQATYEVMSFLRSIPVPVAIMSAHLVDRFGKPKDDKGNDMPYADSVVVGQKLSIRDKIGTNIQTTFDHIFHFEKQMINNQERFFVTFRSDIASTSYSALKEGRHDITGKSFYKFMMEKIQGGK